MTVDVTYDPLDMTLPVCPTDCGLHGPVTCDVWHVSVSVWLDPVITGCISVIVIPGVPCLLSPLADVEAADWPGFSVLTGGPGPQGDAG